MRVPTDPPFSAKVRCVKSIRLDLFLLYTSLFQHPPLFSKSPVCKVNTARPFSFVTKRTFWQHACGHFETWVGGPGLNHRWSFYFRWQRTPVPPEMIRKWQCHRNTSSLCLLKKAENIIRCINWQLTWLMATGKFAIFLIQRGNIYVCNFIVSIQIT